MISLRFARLRRRGVLVVAGTATGIALVGGGVAWAYWDAAASVPTYGFADTVGVGGRPTATPNNGSINLTWQPSTTVGGRAVAGYQVNRYPIATGGTATPAAQGTCAGNSVAATTCTETNVPAGTWYYTVTPVLGAWQGGESPRGNGISTADTFTLSGTSTLTAGTSSTLTITAKAGGQTDTGYSGSRTLTFSGPGNAPNGTAPSYNNGSSSVTFTNGVATIPLSLYKAESATLTVADGTVTGSLPLTVNPGAVSQFAVSTPNSPVAGAAQSVTVTAQDAYQNKATGYTGGKTLAWSGAGTAPDGTHAPSYPANPVTFTSGAATVTITLYRAETTTLTAADNAINGTSGTFTVAAGAATQFNVPTPATQTAGTPFSLTLTALDAYRNTATSYTSTHSLTWSGPGTAPDGTDGPGYPTNPVSFSSGTANVTITLFKAESPTPRATDGTISGTSGSFTVNPQSAARLAWTNVLAPSGHIDSPCFFSCTITGLGNGNTVKANVLVTDGYGNTVNNFADGPIGIGTSGGGSVAPGSVSVPANGPAISGQFTFTGQNGNWTDNLTASFGSLTSATAAISSK